LTPLSVRIDRAVTQFEPGAAEEARRRLLQLRHDCGCREGAIVMLSTTCATVAYLIAMPSRRSALSIAVITLGVLFASAVTGKALGLLSARVRLLLCLRDLEHRSIISSTDE
jgi:hypothetical protein